MRLNFRIQRLLLLAIFMAAFAMMDGFSPPVIESGAFQAERMHKIWVGCLVIFSIGAACVTLVDHKVGRKNPMNIRPAYVAFGLILMGVSAVWLHNLQQSLV